MKRKKRKPFQPDTPEDLLKQDFTGDCYRAAYSWASASRGQGWTLVHGTVLSESAGKRMNHAWCERGEDVMDLAMPVGMRDFKRDKYYEILDARGLQEIRSPTCRIPVPSESTLRALGGIRATAGSLLAESRDDRLG